MRKYEKVVCAAEKVRRENKFFNSFFDYFLNMVSFFKLCFEFFSVASPAEKKILSVVVSKKVLERNSKTIHHGQALKRIQDHHYARS